MKQVEIQEKEEVAIQGKELELPSKLNLYKWIVNYWANNMVDDF